MSKEFLTLNKNLLDNYNPLMYNLFYLLINKIIVIRKM